MKFKFFVVLCTIFVTNFSLAQEKTELEKLSESTGTITILGYTDLGNVQTDPAYPLYGIFIQKRIIKTPVSSVNTRGIVLTVQNYKGENGRSFVYQKEINDLIAALEYISNVTKDITTLENYEVIYATIDGFEVKTYNNNKGDIKFRAKAGNMSQTMTAEFLNSFIQKLKEIKF